MKFKELKIMNELDLESKSAELKKELMKINSQIAIGTLPKSPGKIGEMKRTIARILTIKNNKQKSAENNSIKGKEVEKRNG
ncbi:50S ribosomal protein L29 [Candidatus Woesearchaeota archaeon]|nr:50S ribosomal protein L29 [Candidatus Woesearchaeota archaeon]